MPHSTRIAPLQAQVGSRVVRSPRVVRRSFEGLVSVLGPNWLIFNHPIVVDEARRPRSLEVPGYWCVWKVSDRHRLRRPAIGGSYLPRQSQTSVGPYRQSGDSAYRPNWSADRLRAAQVRSAVDAVCVGFHTKHPNANYDQNERDGEELLQEVLQEVQGIHVAFLLGYAEVFRVRSTGRPA